ncbi:MULTISPECIES: hypothetical protein [unclassified Streptomyces]|uniref:hypothetical protein n=1 Tax=unclassified Streptomyces TaxID=2593676 RepID=UPI00081B3D28|nr:MULTISPECIES: hypothetical protein [unclassified Streptomyces]MYQ82978.1 hypothetical protein [Streptomyces sp. SID4936]SCD56550.1 hypothetical protein GA0115234_103329 [Streptomyces sp. DvalAA-43]
MSEFGGSLFERAQEAPEEVVVTRSVAETRGLQPEDLGALVHILLLPADQRATAKEIAAGMRALDWKMSIDRFEVIAKRLTRAGYLLRESVYDPETTRPRWRYRAYRNPANNPAYLKTGTDTLSQVNGEIGENPVPESQGASETGENPVSPGQSRNRVFPESGAEPGKTRFPSDNVSAGQSRNPEKPGFPVPPPHPPEEEDSSSPYPLTRTTGPLPSQREEGRELALEEIEAAQHFLQRMRQWQAGRATAKKCAPRLLRAMREQGWPALSGMDDAQRQALEAEIFKNTGGATSWVRCLPGWVDDLRLYRAPAQAAPATGQAPKDVAALLRAACPACDPNGWVLDDDDDAPMRRCSHPGVTADTIEETR